MRKGPQTYSGSIRRQAKATPPATVQRIDPMIDPRTDAMRAECERALDAWTQGYDLPLPGLGPRRMARYHTHMSIAPGKCQRCGDFRAGFSVLAAEVAALRAGREEDARLRLFVEAIRDTTTIPALRATAQAVLTGAAVEAARRAGKKRKRKQKQRSTTRKL